MTVKLDGFLIIAIICIIFNLYITDTFDFGILSDRRHT